MFYFLYLHYYYIADSWLSTVRTWVGTHSPLSHRPSTITSSTNANNTTIDIPVYTGSSSNSNVSATSETVNPELSEPVITMTNNQFRNQNLHHRGSNNSNRPRPRPNGLNIHSNSNSNNNDDDLAVPAGAIPDTNDGIESTTNDNNENTNTTIWICSSCTFENPLDNETCGMCGENRTEQ